MYYILSKLIWIVMPMIIDSIVTAYIYKINKSEINKFNRSEYGNRTNSKQGIVEVVGIYCDNPTRGYCFIICFKDSIAKDFKRNFLDFIKR